MKTILPLSKKLVLSAAALALLGAAGCAHRELTAPCSDYKAASFVPAASPSVPCDSPLQMQRPPWVAAIGPTVPTEAGG